MNSNELVARNVRRFRTERQLSLGDVARRSGLSKQTLSKVELGTGNPTVDTLEAIAAALDVPIRRLMTEWGTRVFLVRAGDGQVEDSTLGATSLLDITYGSGYVRTSVVDVISDSETAEHDIHPAGALLHVYVIEGTIVLGPENETFELEPGDFIRFPSDAKYRFHAASSKAKAHVTTTIPQVPQFGPNAPDPR